MESRRPNKKRLAGLAILQAGLILVLFQLFSGTTKADSQVIEIHSAEDLAKIWKDWAYPDNGHYKLMQDIDMSGYGNWEPIYLFSGTFDGNNKTITGLTSQTGGLFGLVNTGGIIRNLTLENVNIQSNSIFIGSLVGSNYGSIENVKVIGGSIIGDSGVGGLVGVHDGGTITGSETSIVVKAADSFAGGMAGDIRSGTISRSSTSGTVEGGSNAGGFAGNAVGTFEEIFATGDVTGTSDIGGLFGGFGNWSPSLLSDSYASGDVSGDEDIGGLIGSASNGITVQRSYALGM
jgi:hypothetical protein